MRFVAMVGLSCLAVAGLATAAEPPATAEDFAFLAGCWASEGREPGSGEQWTQPAGGTLLGTARTVENGRTVATEFLQIRQNDDGSIDFVALPSGQEMAAFRLISMTDAQVTFENPEHDFPQRIMYRLPKDDLLVGRIEGTIDGRERSAEFPMRRVECEAPLPE